MISTLSNLPRYRPLWRCLSLLLALLLTTLTFLVLWEVRQKYEKFGATTKPSVAIDIGTTADWEEWKLASERDKDDIRKLENPDIFTNLNQNQDNINKKIVIGAVSCRKICKHTDQKDDQEDTMKYSEETVTMLKSVLISSKLYNISVVELHLFLEHAEDEEYFRRELEEMGYPKGDSRLEVIIHSAVDFVPEKYRNHMVYHPRYRCGYTRFFFPSALPDVDSIIHIDSDMVITGNMWKMWSIFDEFTEDQIIAAARSNEAHDTHYLTMHMHWFGDIPHPPPRGINAGLLFMKLNRMREYNWEEKFVNVYENYTNQVKLTGQRTVSIVFANDLKILKQVSCQHNFFHRHCDRGFTCLDALQGDNQGGIHLIHGNGFEFEKGGIFHNIYEAYHGFNMTDLRNDEADYEGLVHTLKNRLMAPIRSFYDDSKSNFHIPKCSGTLNYILFQNFFDDENLPNNKICNK